MNSNYTLPKNLNPLMFVGTGSDVGKSVINTAFCRIFLQDGYRPAPFKAQNMSLNSFVTPQGLEIGRAQAVQAEACGLAPDVKMNPVLIKPTGDACSQIVLHGKPVGNRTALEYFNKSNSQKLFKEVMSSYTSLARDYNPVVLEGAGSVSELNLWDKDIVNMKLAQAVKATTFLVADIDRGGVFASVYGSIKLLPPRWRRLIKGVIINKFRGDVALFENGRLMLEKISGVPVVGIIPWLHNLNIEQEDSVVLERMNNQPDSSKVNIAVIKVPHISNFTDFDPLAKIKGVNTYFTTETESIERADIVIIPGSKNVIADMKFLMEKGIGDVIVKMHQKRVPVFGICGGYQMMGLKIRDPYGVEGSPGEIDGLGILPVITTLETVKRTVQCSFSFARDKFITGEGYEIHMGVTSSDVNSPLCYLDDGCPDGFILDDYTWGTYIHGIFDNDSVIKRVLSLVSNNPFPEVNYRQMKERAYDRLAFEVRRHCNMKLIYECLSGEDNCNSNRKS